MGEGGVEANEKIIKYVANENRRENWRRDGGGSESSNKANLIK